MPHYERFSIPFNYRFLFSSSNTNLLVDFVIYSVIVKITDTIISEMYNQLWRTLPIIVLAILVLPLDSARILGLFPHAGESHFVFFEPILRALDNAGHDVHIIGHFEVKNVSSGFRNIIVHNPGSSKNAIDLGVRIKLKLNQSLL